MLGHPVGGAPRDPRGAPTLEWPDPEVDTDVRTDRVVTPDSRWEEPIFQFDPGIIEEESDQDTTVMLPEDYMQLFSDKFVEGSEITFFSSSLLRNDDRNLSRSDWKLRNMWAPQCPLRPNGADIPLDPAIVISNYEDWLSSTGNEQPLLRVEATQDDQLRDSWGPRVTSVTLPNLDSVKPDLIPLVKKSSQYWPGLPPERVQELERILQESFDLACKDYGVEEAIVAGGGYRIPTQELTRDLNLLVQCNGDISAMTTLLQNSRAGQRLSLDRISASLDRAGVSGLTPRETLTPWTAVDTIRLGRLATGGITIPRYDGFSPNLRPPNPKAIYRDVHSAVNCTLIQL